MSVVRFLTATCFVMPLSLAPRPWASQQKYFIRTGYKHAYQRLATAPRTFPSLQPIAASILKPNSFLATP